MGVEPTRPSYSRLVEMLKAVPNTRASRSWVDRVLDINNLKGIYILYGDLCCAVIDTYETPPHMRFNLLIRCR